MDKQRIYKPRPRTGSPVVDRSHDDNDARLAAKLSDNDTLRALLGQVAAEPQRFDRASVRAIVLTAADRLPQ